MSQDDKKPEKRKWRIVPITEEERLRNVRIIEDMRAKGTLEKHEKTFRIDEKGDVVEVTPENP